MKKNNVDQLELPILTEINTVPFKGRTHASRKSSKLSSPFHDNVKAADSDDIKIYNSIINDYFRALSTQKG